MATSKMVKNMDLEFITGLTALPLKDGIQMIKNKATANLEPVIIRFSKDNGEMENVREREC